jgi:hypothetical protein
MTETQRTTFSDEPIGEPGNDVLGRGPFVKSLAEALDGAAAGKASTVFSLVGPWGSGKSSVLALLRKHLTAGPVKWEIVDFNPWSYPDEESMQLGFFSELRAVQPGGDKGQRARQAFGRLSVSIAPFAGLAGSLVNVDGEALAKGLGSLFGGEITTSKAFEEAKGALLDAQQPILMVLDDLDRLDPNELVLVAKLVRLVGRLPNVFYLLSYDESTLLDVLTRTALVGEHEARARDYLEKIIQVRFDLPPLRHDQAEALVSGHLERLSELFESPIGPTDRNLFRDAYRGTLSPRLRTVRSINRYFAQMPLLAQELNTELHLVDFVLITWLRVAEPRLYQQLFEDKDWVLNGLHTNMQMTVEKKTPTQRYERLMMTLETSGVHARDAQAVARLLASLFPALRSDFTKQNDRRGALEADARAKRISHPDYFDRYFHFGLPDGDVPDYVVTRGSEDIERGLDTPATTRLAEALRANAELTTRKIDLLDIGPVRLIRWLIRELETMPEGGEWLSPRAAVEDSLKRLLLRVEPDDFDDLLVDVASSASGLSVLLSTAHALGENRDLTAMYAKLPLDQVDAAWDSLRVMLPDRIRASLHAARPENPLEASSAYWDQLWTWSLLAPDQPRQWLQEQFQGDWDLLDVLGRFVTSVYTSGAPGAHLDHLPASTVNRFFDDDTVFADLDDELRKAPYAPTPSHGKPKASGPARRAIALNDMRKLLADRDAALDATTHGEGAHE